MRRIIEYLARFFSDLTASTRVKPHSIYIWPTQLLPSEMMATCDGLELQLLRSPDAYNPPCDSRWKLTIEFDHTARACAAVATCVTDDRIREVFAFCRSPNKDGGSLNAALDQYLASDLCRRTTPMRAGSPHA